MVNRHCDVCDRIINGDEAEWQVRPPVEAGQLSVSLLFY